MANKVNLNEGKILDLTPQETKKEKLKRLFKDNGLVAEDVYKDKRGFIIITRTGIDKIVAKHQILIQYEPVVIQLGLTDKADQVVMRATGQIGKDGVPVQTFGEASDKNLMGGAKSYPIAMAEKRAMARCVLKLTGFYQIDGVFGEGEISD
ncbi:MAG: hypothetical protein Unbinned5930contig1000_12 [Prokaryotic dsDNA virus sp.]|nr:MAG: hypothetical protein Unbinned5930contig1000_12 [Prokaryotic dsDNA virus sp.]|tara:strand:- start:4671 stop:5123 length:453 start_codon:yes stop_codon:yes gene_type:complete